MKGVAKYVWMDYETTGLHPDKGDMILEVAAIVTDSELVEMGSFQSLVWNGKSDTSDAIIRHERRFQINDERDPEKKPGTFVREMHTKNGLLAELAEWRGRLEGTPDCVEQRLIEFLQPFVPVAPEPTAENPKPKVEPLIIAGSTIWFDRGFAKVWMPKLDAMLSHRAKDVSSDKMLFVDALGMEFPKAEAHRAMDDVRESLGQARQMFEKLRGLSELAECVVCS